ncbi:hypothetical protein B0T22DRAFT_487242 [Podospora appendiculata]|uniref:Uncharacterized protein n=1 Tax=Podospora appendiculata TaxID=314037 RepID=A0AAE1CGC0_9PEZI|nr:hypothetical protein B0T22DRAFT_487242 [Podospora appendiculata]
MVKLLSESLQRLRRAQHAITRRRRRSRVRVSFNHSTSSKGSATKVSRQSRQNNDTQHAPTAAPDSWREAETRNSVKDRKDNGPYPLFARHCPSPSQEGARCLGSPSKRRRSSPKKPSEEDARQAVVRAAEGRPYWSALPRSPVGSPPESSIVAAQRGDEASLSNNANQEGSFSIKRRPVPTGPKSPRYLVFPKPPCRQIPPALDSRLCTTISHSKSVRRSLSQQRRLSSLVPADQGLSQLSLVPKPVEFPLCFREADNLAKSSRQRKVDKFKKDLEDFSKTAHAPSQIPERVMNEKERQVSVNTVQELLPFRQQFVAAGLAVTSVDQKAPHKSGTCLSPRSGSSGDDRLRFGGVTEFAQQTTVGGSKESNNDTVIHFQQHDALSLALVKEPPSKKPKERSRDKSEKLKPNGKIVPLLQTPESSPSEIFMEQEQLQPTRRKLFKPRPSAVFLTSKPLPTQPSLMSPTDSKDSRGTSHKDPGQLRRSKLGEPSSNPRAVANMPQASAEEPHVDPLAFFSEPSQSKQVVRVGDVEKSLPALPTLRVSSQIRHGVVVPGKASWVPGARKVPMTIVEEKEPSSERQDTAIDESCIIRHTGTAINQAQNKENITIESPEKAVDTSIDSKLELPETWKNAVSTPSSFEKALDDVVRKLEDMEEKRTVTGSVKLRPRSKGISSKAPSPSRRLQRAAAMRCQRMAEHTVQDLEPVKRSAPPAPSRSASRLATRSSSNSRKASKPAKERGVVPSHDDKDISDKDVLKGLKIVCAASADEDLDAWIRSKTGLRLRRFLADLKTFENLSEDGILAMDGQRAKERKSEKRRLQAEKDGLAQVSTEAP